MKLKDKNIGFVLTGSFCTFNKTIEEIEKIIEEGGNIIPIMSSHAYEMDTKFGDAKEHIDKIEKITGKKIIHTIQGAEPIGPQKLTDIIIIAPCTGNTIAKLANGITDDARNYGNKITFKKSEILLL